MPNGVSAADPARTAQAGEWPGGSRPGHSAVVTTALRAGARGRRGAGHGQPGPRRLRLRARGHFLLHDRAARPVPLFEDFLAGYAEAAALAGDHSDLIRRSAIVSGPRQLSLWLGPGRNDSPASGRAGCGPPGCATCSPEGRLPHPDERSPNVPQWPPRAALTPSAQPPSSASSRLPPPNGTEVQLTAAMRAV